MSPRPRALAIDAPTFDLSEARGRLLALVLRVGATLGAIAWLPSFVLALVHRAPGVAILDTLAYAVVLALASARRLAYPVRAAGLIGVVYALGAVLLLVLGPGGAGTSWLVAGPIVATVAFGRRGLVAGMAVQAAVIVAYAVGAATGRLPGSSAPPVSLHELQLWVVHGANIVLLSGASALAVDALIVAAASAAGAARAASVALEAEHARLEEAHRDLVEATARRAELEARLREAERLEGLGTLAAGIGHAFNNLLAPVIARTEEVRGTLPPADTRRSSLTESLDAAERARVLVRRMRTLAGHRAPAEPVALGELVRDALDRLRAPAGVEVTTSLPDDGGWVRAPRDELLQVVLDLATNALHAGGRRIALTITADADHVRLDVADDGEGMDAATLARAFDPFFTRRASGEGVGLGLPFAHGLVAGLGGRVALRSEPGAGTTATVTLPRCAAPAEVEVAPAASPCPPRLRVLVVDDEPLLRSTVGTMLDRIGHEAVTAASVAEALAVVERTGVDVVLTDQSMPVATGLDLADRLHAGHADLPIVLMSGLLDGVDESLLRHRGIVAVLEKPFRLAALREVLGALHAARKPAA